MSRNTSRPPETHAHEGLALVLLLSPASVLQAFIFSCCGVSFLSSAASKQRFHGALLN